MQYTKAIVDLIQEARRRAPSEFKPSIKLANPEVLSILLDLYKKSTDSVFKALVKEVFSLAGGVWSTRIGELEQTGKVDVEESYSVKVYRGQTRLEPKTASEDIKKPKMVYRGRVVMA
ncbi:hypothetical protein [Sessilibacter sp. MAH2]